MLSKKNRLPGQQIPQVIKGGKKKETNFFNIFYISSNNLQFTVIAPKKFFNKAVKRNQVKRKLRAAIRKAIKNKNWKMKAVIIAKKVVEKTNVEVIQKKIEKVLQNIE